MSIALEEKTKKDIIIHEAKKDPFKSIDEIALMADTTARYVRTILSEAEVSLTKMRKNYAKLLEKRIIKIANTTEDDREKEIETICEKIKIVWKENPDMNLNKLLMEIMINGSAGDKTYKDDFYNLTDSELESFINIFLVDSVTK